MPNHSRQHAQSIRFEIRKPQRTRFDRVLVPDRGKTLTERWAFGNSATYRAALSDVDGAREAAHEGLRWARQAQNVQLIATVFQHFALLAALGGHVSSATHLIGYVNVQIKETGSERAPTEKWVYEKLMATLREHLSAAEIEKLAAEGAAWSEDQAVEEALQM